MTKKDNDIEWELHTQVMQDQFQLNSTNFSHTVLSIDKVKQNILLDSIYKYQIYKLQI